MKLRTLLFILVLLSALTASAYDAVINGIGYNFDTNTLVATVTSGGTQYTGSVTSFLWLLPPDIGDNPQQRDRNRKK